MKAGDKIEALVDGKDYKRGERAEVLYSHWLDSEEYCRVVIKERNIQFNILADNWKKIYED